ncbi:MAG: hypothetical protein H8D78_06130 [Chloroflexi bacterium]|nr:hypothetical protein [Chloroflexota bacterium]
MTERDVSELIEAYEPLESGSLTQRARSFLQDEQKCLQAYLSNPSREVNDLAEFYRTATVDGDPVYNDLADERVQVALPDKPANRVVSEVMKKVMVSIEPVKIHDWSLTVDTADLYFRPLYVFEFERASKEGDISETKLEQLDALSRDWSTLSSREVKQSSVPWNKILLLTMDATAVVLQELGGPWLRAAGGLLEVGTEHIPDIVEEMRRPEGK